jgi:hypothetical protein
MITFRIMAVLLCLVLLRWITIYTECRCAECHYAECRGAMVASEIWFFFFGLAKKICSKFYFQSLTFSFYNIWLVSFSVIWYSTKVYLSNILNETKVSLCMGRHHLIIFNFSHLILNSNVSLSMVVETKVSLRMGRNFVS